MDYLMKLVTTALAWTAARGETDVSAATLEAAAELLTLRRDAIRLIDGEEEARLVGLEACMHQFLKKP
jgi:hypothetical protein